MFLFVFVALRPTFTAVRAMPLLRVMVRGVVTFAVRETTARDAPVLLALRSIVKRLRVSVFRADTDDVVSPRKVTFCDCGEFDFLALVFVVRRAASVAPMHKKHAVIKDRIPFILSIIIMISKNGILGQVLFARKNKKPAIMTG